MLEQWLSGIALEQMGMGKMLLEPTWEGLLLAQAQVYDLTAQIQQQGQALADWNQNFMDRIGDACLKRLESQ